MKRHFAATMFMLSACLYFLPGLSLAQEATQDATQPAVEAEETAPSALDETEFSYGTVKSVTDNQLVVSEYDYDKDQDVDVTYTVQPDTKFENVTSVAEIKAGDTVDIDFLVKNSQKIASLISVEKPGAEDEDLTLATDEVQT